MDEERRQENGRFTNALDQDGNDIEAVHHGPTTLLGCRYTPVSPQSLQNPNLECLANPDRVP
jgi:hypothetical protein